MLIDRNQLTASAEQHIRACSTWSLFRWISTVGQIFFNRVNNMSVFIDAYRAAVNYYNSNRGTVPHTQIIGQSDCTIKENALKVLGLTEEESQNQVMVSEKYRKAISALDQRIAKLPLQLGRHLQDLRANYVEAYNTLTQSESITLPDTASDDSQNTTETALTTNIHDGSFE